MRYTLRRHQYLTGWTHYAAWRHRERVRFGAWEAVALNRVREHVCLERHGEDRHPCGLWTRHQGPHWWPYDPPLDVTPLLEELRGSVKAAALAATGRLTPGTGGSEGPPVSGPENAYKCAHCGRALGSFEAGIARIGDSPVCHPNDDAPDCYRLVTVYGEELGARR